ncbi:30S ribosomal protein S11, chloroplastic [Bonamia ostreae]|uniref:30S ribosomal protein S11, chloroplastic n=1 Tax=Bonamia ostreae TaxID=126728 RepID=A0ABV2AFX5_9EUKA
MADQNQRAFQKQPTIFLGSKRLLARKTKEGKARFWKNIGLGFKTPDAAKHGTFIDKKCPFTGNISIRGRILSGKVISAKMQQTIVVKREYMHFVKKYNRFEKRHKNVSVHCSPAFKVKIGDLVTFGQCRPLSKTVRFNVLRIDRKSDSLSDVKVFKH